MLPVNLFLLCSCINSAICCRSRRLSCVEGPVIENGNFLDPARLIALAQQHIHRLGVQLGAPVGQLDPVAVHRAITVSMSGLIARS